MESDCEFNGSQESLNSEEVDAIQQALESDGYYNDSQESLNSEDADAISLNSEEADAIQEAMESDRDYYGSQESLNSDDADAISLNSEDAEAVSLNSEEADAIQEAMESDRDCYGSQDSLNSEGPDAFSLNSEEIDAIQEAMESDSEFYGNRGTLFGDMADRIQEVVPTALMESLPPAMTQTTIKEDDGTVSVSSHDVGSSLLSALECPVCFDYMVPPIRLCSNGHNLCSECQPKMECCPICREGFLQTRNIALEKIARELQYPCRNREAGCDEKYPIEMINDHQAVCSCRFHPCMLSTDS